MAKRVYSAGGMLTGRRLVLVVTLVIVIIFAAIRLTSEKAAGGGQGERTPIDIGVKGSDDPPVTVPDNAEQDAGDDIAQPDNVDVDSPQAVRAGEFFQVGRSAFESQDYISARNKLSQALKLQLPQQKRMLAYKMINTTADAWLFSSNVFYGDDLCSRYKVESGDLLSTIGPKYDIPYQFIMRINNISDPQKLRAGDIIKVVRGPFHVIVNRSANVMFVYLGDLLVRTYRVSVGMTGRETPLGRWRVKKGSKLINPEWRDPDTYKIIYPDDPLNPLGERWIGLEGIEGDSVGQKSYGIHGTIEPETIGKPASRGCIRMHNKDVEELFDMLIEVKSIVLVVD